MKLDPRDDPQELGDLTTWGSGQNGICPPGFERGKTYADPDKVKERGRVTGVERIVADKAGIKIEVNTLRNTGRPYKLEHWEVWGLENARAAMKSYLLNMPANEFNKLFRSPLTWDFAIAASGGRRPC